MILCCLSTSAIRMNTSHFRCAAKVHHLQSLSPCLPTSQERHSRRSQPWRDLRIRVCMGTITIPTLRTRDAEHFCSSKAEALRFSSASSVTIHAIPKSVRTSAGESPLANGETLSGLNQLHRQPCLSSTIYIGECFGFRVGLLLRNLDYVFLRQGQLWQPFQ